MSISSVYEGQLNKTALAIAPPTATIANAAAYYRCSVEEMILQLLFSPLDMPTWDGKGNEPVPKLWLPGINFGSCNSFGPPAYGPRGKSKVMVIGKMPGGEELRMQKNFVGASGRMLRELAMDIRWEDFNSAYMTNVVRYIPPDGGKTLKPQHVQDCFCLLAQEIAIVRPDLLLLLGADAVKAVCGKDGTLSGMRGNVFQIPGLNVLGTMPRTWSEIDEMHKDYIGLKVVVTTHPAAVLREGGLMAGFKSDFCLARDVANKSEIKSPTDVSDRDYTYTDNPEELNALVDKLILQGVTDFSVDLEGGGRDYKSGTLRTIQFSWGPKTACVVILARCGGEPIDQVTRQKLIAALRRVLCREGVRISGHNFRYDAKRLEYIGLNVMDYFHFDTMLADHILNENAEHGLEACTVRYTDMGRYDWPLAKWLKDNGYNEKKLRDRGYLDVPDELLFPYAACDTDATWRCWRVLNEMLFNNESNTSLANLFKTIIIPNNYPLHEAESNGLLVDRDRMINLVELYAAKKEEILSNLRMVVGNPHFNPRSYPQAKELLFDTLKLTPFKTTGKPSIMWEDLLLLPEEEQRRHNPSTDSETLASLANDDTGIVALFRDFKIIDQMTKSFLRGPEMGDDGHEDYEDGLVGSISKVDGRVHTSLSQTSETGRQKSSGPNMQNLPKKQDKEFSRIMGDSIPKIRSCFVAPPGRVIVEADFKSAEIYTLGYLANCHRLIADAAADLHARGAVNYFGVPKWDGFDQLKKPPKDWLKQFKSERVGAKTVNFGIPYQRGAKAVARQIIRETEGLIQCTPEMAQKFIDGYYQTYPEVAAYVKMCKDAVKNPGYISNAYGRRRRFINIAREDRATLASYERESVNMPIQGTVAETLNVAMINLWWWRKVYPGRCHYDFLLPVHDATLGEMAGEEAPLYIEEVLPQCMKFGAVIPSWEPAGFKHKTIPFTLDIDIEVFVRWGEPAKPEELKRAGVPDKFIEKWSHD